jgi:hypothetical protein
LTWDRIARKSPAAITFGIRTTSVIGISARVGGSGAYPKPRELTESEENELSTLRQEYNGLVARHKEPDNAKFGERMDKIDKRVAELSVKEYDPAEVVEAYAVITMEYSGEVKVRRPREEGKEIGGAVAQARPNWAGDGSRPSYCYRMEPAELQPVLAGLVSAWRKQALSQSASIIMATPLQKTIVQRASYVGGSVLAT